MPAIPTNVASYLATHDRVNVRDFGAVGDGVTDDTAAFAAAILAATSEVPGQVNVYTPGAAGRARLVYVPTGYYKITQTLDTTGTLGMIGDLSGDLTLPCSRILCDVAGAATVIHQTANGIFENISWQGATLANQTGLHLAMVPGETNGGLLRVRACHFQDFNAAGAIALLIDEGTGTALNTIDWITECHWESNNVNVKVIGYAIYFVACDLGAGGAGQSNGSVIVGDNSGQQPNEQLIFFIGCSMGPLDATGVTVYANGAHFIGCQIGGTGVTIEAGGSANLVGCVVGSGVVTNNGGNFGNTPAVYGVSPRTWTIQPTTNLNGTTAGTALWVMDEQGTHKRFVCVLNGYENTGGVAQTIAFPVGFAHQAAIVSQPAGFGATVTTAQLNLPTAMAGPVSGVIIVEGI